MNMLVISVFVFAGLGLSNSATAQVSSLDTQATPISKQDYLLVKKQADAQLQVDKAACLGQSELANEVCLAGAVSKVDVAKADAEVAYRDTPKARENARVARNRLEALRVFGILPVIGN